jgi:hypothetical protein
LETPRRPPKARKPKNPKRISKKRVYHRKPDRNTITNIGRLVLTFAGIRKRSGDVVARLFPVLSEVEVRDYYCFASQLKESTQSYLNLEKFTALWSTSNGSDPLHHATFRRLCSYFLLEQLVPALLTSKRMNTETGREVMSMDPQ